MHVMCPHNIRTVSTPVPLPLHPNGDGLQPIRDGLQPTSDGLRPTSDGLQAMACFLHVVTECHMAHTTDLCSK